MMKLTDRDKLDSPEDQTGFALARGGLVALFPLVPGMDHDPLSFLMEPHVHAVAALVGEAVAFRFTTRGYNTKWELLRKPAGSAARFNVHTLTLDVAGVYHVRVWLGAWRRDIAVGAWPLAELARLGCAPQPGKPDAHYYARRERLQGVCSDPRVTPETLRVALEGNPTFGFDGTIYGPGQAPVNTSW